jgi:caa(3)-type oxidase subunit IV
MRTYWVTWAVLLVFTLLMLWADGASQSIPRLAFVIFMLAAMLVKASLIAANFMHLGQERVSLVMTVVIGLFVTGLVLWALIAPDAVRIAAMGGVD